MKNYGIREREIKFRFWEIEEKEMLDSLDIGSNDTVWVEQFFNMKDDFIPMQYTGLKDKNGEEIYEGDIAKDILDDFYEILFDEAKFVTISGNVIEDLSETHKDLEVIGNVFENPTLTNLQDE